MSDGVVFEGSAAPARKPYLKGFGRAGQLQTSVTSACETAEELHGDFLTLTSRFEIALTASDITKLAELTSSRLEALAAVAAVSSTTSADIARKSDLLLKVALDFGDDYPALAPLAVSIVRESRRLGRSGKSRQRDVLASTPSQVAVGQVFTTG